MPLGNAEEDDESIILSMFGKKPSGSEKFKARWIEFDCQKGVHHGKWSTYKDGKRIREEGGFIGGFDKVAALGQYATRRIREFVNKHDCHYPERFARNLDDCQIAGIEVKGWPSGRGFSGLPSGGRADSEAGGEIHKA